MSNELVPTNTDQGFALLLKQADMLSQSKIVPTAYRNRPADIVAAGMAGRAYSWDVMTSLRNFHVIESTASLRPEAMLGLVRKAGHSVVLTTEDSDEGRMVVATGTRGDNGDTHTAKFSEEDAKKAGLADKRNWKQYLDAMLTWRSISALCRVLFPDVVLGAGYVPEEIGAEVDEYGMPLEADPLDDTVPVAEAKRRVLDACDGDKQKAREWWGDRDGQITEPELDALLADIESAEIIDAEVVEEEEAY